ncbi:TPA: cupin domain-containing protein, partial [Klebsiella pneumoniae]
ARQLIWLQQGELVFVEGNTRHEMQAGDCLELGPPNDCRFINESAETCVYLVVRLNQSPSGS